MNRYIMGLIGTPCISTHPPDPNQAETTTRGQPHPPPDPQPPKRDNIGNSQRLFAFEKQIVFMCPKSSTLELKNSDSMCNFPPDTGSKGLESEIQVQT